MRILCILFKILQNSALIALHAGINDCRSRIIGRKGSADGLFPTAFDIAADRAVGHVDSGRTNHAGFAKKVTGSTGTGK